MILISGSGGQLGCEIKDIISTKHKVISLDRSKLDITEKSQIKDIFQKYKPKTFINCAAYTKVDEAEKNLDQANKINGFSLENICKFSNDFNTRLVHFSTDYVFDGKASSPYDENSSTNPINAYGKSKLLGENIVKTHSKNFTIIRTSWVYSNHGHNFFNTMLNNCNSDVLKVVNDQYGSPTSTYEIAKLIDSMLNEKNYDFCKNKLFHFTGNTRCTWYGLAKIIFEQAKKSKIITEAPKIIPVSTEDFNLLAKRPKYSILDCSEAYKIYNPELDLKKNIFKLLNY